MLSMFGFIKQELKAMGKLPAKYEDPVAITAPSMESCWLYADALNNTGTLENPAHSSAPSKWVNLATASNSGLSSVAPLVQVGSPTWSDDCVYLPRGSRYSVSKFSASEFTVEAVFRSPAVIDPSLSLGTQIIFGNQYNLSVGYGFSLFQTSDGELGFNYYNANGNHRITLETPGLGSIYYVCATFDSAKAFITSSVDPENPAEGVGGSIKYTSGFNAAIGSHGRTDGGLGTEDQASPYIYSIRVYKRALSKEEIAKNMAYEKYRYKF